MDDLLNQKHEVWSMNIPFSLYCPKKGETLTHTHTLSTPTKVLQIIANSWLKLSKGANL